MADSGTPSPRRTPDGAPAGYRSTSYRSPGRPRDTRCDEAIISATLHALASSGFSGLSMEAVATRAGVGKATVYRRWATKEALVADALATLAEEFEPVDTGSLREDLVAWLNAVRRHNIQTLSGRIMPGLLAEKDAHPDLFDTYRQRVISPSRERIAVVLRRGIASGELAPDVDIDLVTDMLVGAVSYRQYIGGSQEVTSVRIGVVVDAVLDGIRGHSHTNGSHTNTTDRGPSDTATQEVASRDRDTATREAGGRATTTRSATTGSGHRAGGNGASGAAATGRASRAGRSGRASRAVGVPAEHG